MYKIIDTVVYIEKQRMFCTTLLSWALIYDAQRTKMARGGGGGGRGRGGDAYFPYTST